MVQKPHGTANRMGVFTGGVEQEHTRLSRKPTASVLGTQADVFKVHSSRRAVAIDPVVPRERGVEHGKIRVEQGQGAQVLA